MKEKFRQVIVLSFILLAANGCEKGFDELNVSPTGSITTSPDGLFTVATQRGSLTWFMWDRAQRLTCNLYAQYNSIDRGIVTDYYDPYPGVFNDIWDRSYGDQDAEFAPMFHCRKAAEIAALQGNPHKEGMARIWNVFLFQRMTDMFGDIPYKDAFTGTQPAFDRQEDIYRDFLSEIKTGKALLSQPGNYPSFGTADLIYQGARDKWEKFANTLLLRMALRVHKVDPVLSMEFIDAMESGAVLSSNDDNNAMKWDAIVANIYFRNPILVTEVFANTRISHTMVERLSSTNDPRLSLYAKPALTDGAYRGLVNGRDALDEASKDDSFFDQYSRLGDAFLKPDGYTYNLHYPEACFLMSEAVLKNLLPGDAAEWYGKGIEAAMQLYGITDQAVIDAYRIQEGIAFDPDRAMEQIHTQKWISLCMNGIEAWIEIRRTGLPVPDPIAFPGSVNNGQYPRRLIYSDTERALNAAQVQVAIDRMGGDTQLQRVWWDVE
ncbi:MAG: hypothetical protein RLY31_2876 [Bacteroidota bacterium]|jgi:hypothetical protein